MRTAMFILFLNFACAAAPAFAQARVLNVPQSVVAQGAGQPQGPAVEPGKQPQPPVDAQGAAKTQDQLPSEVLRQNLGRPLVPGRYSFTRVENGLLRLDLQAGGVAFCRSIEVGWVCDAVPEERAALEKEMDSLRAELKAAKEELAAAKIEIAGLRGEIDGLRAPPPPPLPPQTVPPPPSSDRDGFTIKLPTQEEVARARDFVADTWRRLIEMIAELQKDVLPKS